MKFDVEELAATKRKIKVEIPPSDIEEALDAAYAELNRSVKVDGFRPGKTPRVILEKRYARSVESEVVERLVPRFYMKAIEQSKTVPVETPSLEEKALSIKKGEPLSFTAVVEVRPEFALSEYRGIELRDEPAEVTDEELAEAVEELRDMHSTLETVAEDRPAARGDFAVIDFQGFVDDKPLEGGRAENYPLELGSGAFIPGFEEQMEGAVKGVERDVKVSFPADYKNKELSGKDALFKVTLKELKQKVKPALDDEFAKDAGMGGTLAELKERLRQDILGYKERARAARQKDEIIKQLVKANSLELPPSMVEKELRSIIMRRYQELQQSGKAPSGAGFDIKSFEEEARPVAAERVKTSLILAAIADKEDIKVSDAEMEAGIKRLAGDSGYNAQKIKELYEKRDGSLEGLRGIIGEDKVLDFLLKEARKS